MSALVASALAAIFLELAKSSGHELGLRLVAAIWPALSKDWVDRFWAEVRKRVSAPGGHDQVVAAVRRMGSGDMRWEPEPMPEILFRPEMDLPEDRVPLREAGPG